MTSHTIVTVTESYNIKKRQKNPEQIMLYNMVIVC